MLKKYIFTLVIAIFSILSSTNQKSFAQNAALDSFILPRSKEPGRITPRCAGPGPTTADVLVKKLGEYIDSITTGEPIVSTIVKNEEISNWLKVRLGIHNGPAVCRTWCVAIPKGSRFEWMVTANDYEYKDGKRYGDINQSAICSGRQTIHKWDGGICEKSPAGGNNEFAIGWAKLDPITTYDKGNKTVVCFNVRNWKHDWSRTFSFKIAWK